MQNFARDTVKSAYVHVDYRSNLALRAKISKVDCRLLKKALVTPAKSSRPKGGDMGRLYCIKMIRKDFIEWSKTKSLQPCCRFPRSTALTIPDHNE